MKDALKHLAVILGLTLVLIFIFFYLYLPVTTNHGETVKVPDLKGKSLSELETLLGEQELRYQVNDSSYVAGAPVFSVIAQHPVAGSEVKANRNIYVTITSRNPPLVSMPELKDKSIKTAELELKSRDLILEKTNSVPGPFLGVILQQYVDGKLILPGAMIPKGSKITLDVGNGSSVQEIEPETTATDNP